jgi:putative membrane protein
VRPDPYAWGADLETLVLVPGLAAAYWVATRFHATPRWRAVSFLLGLSLILAAFVTPLESLSLHYLLSAHLLQNVVLAEWAPGLCVLGLPAALAARIAEQPWLQPLTRPLVALPLWLATYFAWHVPWAYDAALRRPDWLLHVEHLSYFTAGCLLWWPVVHERPWRLGAGAKAVYLFGAFVLASPLGLLLALLPSPVYGVYKHAPRLWGLSATADQQIAGVTMAAEQAIVFFVACAVQFTRFLQQESGREAFRSSSRPPRAG